MQASPPKGAPIADTFEKELEQIQEKEKDMKGEQRKFYSSIVARVKNNCEILADLREEHANLRAKLTKMRKMERLIEPNLEHTLKHRQHEVTLLVKQIDMLKHQREEAIKRQKELELSLANYQSAETAEHPELDRIRVLQNKLDKANIKNGETKHLMKIYQGIINQFDKQQMLWNPVVREQQAEIEKKHRDISELSLIARDSKYSRATAKTEFTRTQKQCNENQKKRERQLKAKKKLLIDIDSVESTDPPSSRRVRAQPSLGSTPSQLRNKMNKQLRERREEKFRQVSAEYEKIQAAFGTTDPKTIHKFFQDKRDTTTCLNQQIQDLKKAIKATRKQIDKLKLEIEEQEFTTARGVGNSRMMREGRNILAENKSKLKKKDREIEAFQEHQKQVCSGIAHLVDLLSLVTQEESSIPTNFPAILDWVTEKASHYQNEIESEETNFTDEVNPQVYCQYKARTGVVEEEVRKSTKRDTTFRRQAREQKGDVQTRVLDRNAVKAAAAKAMQMAQQQKRPVQRR